jgi:hypothetical protein
VAAFGVEQIQNGGRCHGNQGALAILLLLKIYLAFKCFGFDRTW